MQLVKKAISKDGAGFIVVIPEDTEDLWHAYNLIAEGDYLRAKTTRQVVTESLTGASDKKTVVTTLTIEVKTIEYDVQGGMLRVNGQNAVENPHVKMHAYHTIDVKLHRPFTLAKYEWDSIALDRIRDACDVTAKADVAAIVLQEGLAHVCLVTQSMTVVRQRIEVSVPKKRKGSTTNYDKGLRNFFGVIYQALQTHVNFDIVKVVILASPGFYKDQLYEYIFAEAVKGDVKPVLQNKPKFITATCASGHKMALNDVLKQPGVQSKMTDTKFAQEIKVLDRFYGMLGSDASRAYYGYNHVASAAELGAVDVLLVTDGLFRSANVSTRKRYAALVDKVKTSGGKVHLFSTCHVSGEQLDSLTGVAAILLFPCPDIENEPDMPVEETPEVVQTKKPTVDLASMGMDMGLDDDFMGAPDSSRGSRQVNDDAVDDFM